jgi:hypothetical protein
MQFLSIIDVLQMLLSLSSRLFITSGRDLFDTSSASYIVVVAIAGVVAMTAAIVVAAVTAITVAARRAYLPFKKYSIQCNIQIFLERGSCRKKRISFFQEVLCLV